MLPCLTITPCNGGGCNSSPAGRLVLCCWLVARLAGLVVHGRLYVHDSRSHLLSCHDHESWWQPAAVARLECLRPAAAQKHAAGCQTAGSSLLLVQAA